MAPRIVAAQPRVVTHGLLTIEPGIARAMRKEKLAAMAVEAAEVIQRKRLSPAMARFAWRRRRGGVDVEGGGGRCGGR